MKQLVDPGISIAGFDNEFLGMMQTLTRELEQKINMTPSFGNPQLFRNQKEYDYLRAASDQNFKKVFECLNKQVNINAQSPTGFGVLHCALFEGKLHYPLLFFLLSQDNA